jgi:hypothetical protein
MTHGDALCWEAQGGTAMKRPNAAGSVLQALEPVAKKLAEMEQRALAGQPTAVVQMGCELADSLREGTSSRPTRTLYAHGSPRISARSTKAARWGSSSIWPRNENGERVPSSAKRSTH